MTFAQLTIVFLILVLVSGVLGWRRVRIPQLADGIRPRSRAVYHGVYNALWCALPMLVVVLAWLAVEPGIIRPAVLAEFAANSATIEANNAFKYVEIRNIAEGVLPSESADESVLQAVGYYRVLQQQSSIALTILFVTAGLSGLYLGYKRLGHLFPAREKVEGFVRLFLFVSASIAILTTISIVLALAFETLRFFQHVPVMDFLLGTKWSPQVAIRADQVGSSGAFGAVPLFAGTLLIALIAMLIAVPVGLFSAIYLAEYAHPTARHILKPMLEILAGIPTVVYGFFAALTVAPMIVDLGHGFGLETSSESALAAGLVMGFMIIPFISSLSDDVINSVPYSLRDGSLAMGATKSETIRKVILPAALPGIAGAILLAVSRAIGETMIVVMAAGLAARLTANPLESVTTVTAQIVTILVGDQEFDSPKTLAAFALGLTLFFVTLTLNFIALHVVRKYREQYD
ncbi:MAG TPA: phosphate ABC transporter permease subunit PstC [Gammaproteobacteria bacterium]|nr:phosphate ABC transporter permease subunit PstC [Gammaproteobacteria bacterium]